MSQASTFWPTAPDVGPGAKATTILTNLQRGNVPTQNISNVRWLSPFSNFRGIARDLRVTTQGRGCLPESGPGGFGSERSAAMAEVEQILKKDNYKHFASRETGDDIERPDVQGLTMLMWASAYGQTPTVQVGF